MQLFIPGPIWCREDVLAAMAQQPLGHRGKEFTELLSRLTPRLQKLLYTEGPVYISTSSGSGVWELAVRNCVRRKALACVCGAFSDKWADVAEWNGKEVVRLEAEWGQAVKPDMVGDALRQHPDVDAVLFVHNETSTGVTNPLAEVGEVIRQRDDVLFLVDAVSSMAGLKIEVDAWGIDICLGSSQKAFGIPPGMAVFSASPRAHERARSIEHRGYYFDLLQFEKAGAKGQTVTTPAIPHIYALERVLERIDAEGLDARWARHRDMAEFVRGWSRERYSLFAEPGYESDTVTCITNTAGIDIPALNAALSEKRDCIISDGYGPLKGKTFRIAHMGDMTVEQLQDLTSWIDEILTS